MKQNTKSSKSLPSFKEITTNVKWQVIIAIVLIVVALLSQVLFIIGLLILLYVGIKWYMNKKKKEGERSKEV